MVKIDIAVLLISSFAIGVAVTAPIGPINLMVIRTALQQGFWAGVWVGLGSVLGDGIFAGITAFGLKALFSFFQGFAFWLQLAGGLLMVAYGAFSLISEKKASQDDLLLTPQKSIGRIAPLGTTLVLTLTNPATMLGFVGLFGALSSIADYTSSYLRSAMVITGVMLGSLAWICSLSAFICWLHKNLSQRAIGNINRAAAFALILFGVTVLGNLFLNSL